MPSQKVKDLAALFGLKSQDDANGVFTAQAMLANQTTADELAANARRNGRVMDAYWKAKCPDYKPEDDVAGNNFVNCSIVSDKAINQLAAFLSQDDCGNPTDPQPLPPPSGTRPKWWRVVLATLVAVVLGALIVFLVARYFLDVGEDPAIYEIIATDQPFEVPQPMDGF